VWIDLLRVDGLRNLADIELRPSPGINVIHGSNASGKTSLLESIYLLGRGRSFRSQRSLPLIQKGREQFTAFAVLRNAQGTKKTMGISRSTEGFEIHVDRERVKRLSELAKVFPFQIVTPRSHEILDAGAKFRRRMLDWGVFHVEPGFHHWYTRYRAALSQRNAALRQGMSDLGIWDKEMTQAAGYVEKARDAYIAELKRLFETTAQELNGLDCHYVFRFLRGYPKDMTLLEALDKSRIEDRKRGYTYYGPHRADFRIICERGDASDVASGGQKRLLVFTLNIAQADIVRTKTNHTPIWLLDDFTAELDRENRKELLSKIAGLAEQVFVTTTDPELVEFQGVSIDGMFHVEHGRIV